LLPGIGETIVLDKTTGVKLYLKDDVNLMGLLNNTDELDVFGTKSVQELIAFKWDSYALTHHLVGCFFHFFYLAILIIYINIIYIKDTGSE
jgi:hypothetical protein